MKYCLDPTHHITRRMGFASIPLACVVIRFISERTHFTSLSPMAPLRGVIVLLLVACVFAIKVLVNIVLLGHAACVGDGGLSDYTPPGQTAMPTVPPLAAQPQPEAPPLRHHPMPSSPPEDQMAPGASPNADPVVARVAKMHRYRLHRSRIPI